MTSLRDNPSYRRFIAERDQALEELHRQAQVRISNLLALALEDIVGVVAASAARNGRTGIMMLRQELEWLRRSVDAKLAHVFPAMLQIYVDLQRKAYLLSSAGEVEAIGRALRKKKQFNINVPEEQDGENAKRIGQMALALDRINRDVIDAYQAARVADEPVEGVIDRVRRSFPKAKRYKRGPKFLRAVKPREAAKKKADPYSFGILDENEWAEMLDLFKRDFVPATRGPGTVFDVDTDGTGVEVEWYGWEIEQSLTDEFVKSVRSGQVDAAKTQGIKDFQWVAVIDSATDECCLWRDGLTSTQIESRLSSSQSDDECGAIVPPAHFNCRCTLAPVTEEEPSDDVYNPQSFEDWLMS